MPKPPPYGYDEAKRRRPRTALRLVEPGEDPRVLSTDPDHFLKEPSVPVAALGFSALTVSSALSIGLSVDAFVHGDPLLMPMYVILSLLSWLVIGPLWGFWISRQRRRPRIRRGREQIAAIPADAEPELGRAVWVSYVGEDPVRRRGVDVHVVVEAPSGETVFIDARSKRRPPSPLFTFGDPVWIWRSEDGWVFGQVTHHGQDPTYSAADEPQPPTWEEQHGGHSPAYFVAELSKLAEQYRAGSLSRQDYEVAKNRLLGL